jgi:hypothetical protein
VLTGGAAASGYVLRTFPPAGTGEARFAVLGDSGSGRPDQLRVATRIGQDVEAGLVDFAVHTGDVVHPTGTYRNLQAQFFDIYAGWLHRIPVFPTIGNHDEVAGRAGPYLDVFALPEHAGPALAPDDGERYYSFEAGPAHIVSVNTQSAFHDAERSQQLAWLEADLASTTQPWRIVFLHRPPYPSWDDPASGSVRAVLAPVFERHGVQLVLAGHEHTYARSTPWRSTSESRQAVTYVVTGGGGAVLEDGHDPATWRAIRADAHHHLRVTATGCEPAATCRATLETVRADGVVIDRFVLDQRAQAGDTAPPTVDIVEPTPGGTLRGPAAVRVLADDDTVVTKVDLTVDGILFAVDAAAPFEFALDTLRLAEGPHAIRATAWDLAGRSQSSALRAVVVDNVPGSALRVLAPNEGQRLFSSTAAFIEWAVDDAVDPVRQIDVLSSADGAPFEPVPGCTGLPSTARRCTWLAPGPVGGTVALRVVAATSSGAAIADESDAPVRIAPGVAALRVTAPEDTSWARGSTREIAWSHTLGAGSRVRVEVSADNGATWTLVAPAVTNATASRGTVLWRVAGLDTTGGRVRVSWLDGAAMDVSDTTFTIGAPFVSMTQPRPGTGWGHGTRQRVAWKTNLGPFDTLDIELVPPGAAPIAISRGATASQRSATVLAPVLPVAATGRLRLSWALDPAVSAASGPLVLGPPFVQVTAPEAGAVWPVGGAATIRWAHNLGTLESVRLELSLDAGVSFPVLLSPATKSDGQETVAVPASWRSEAAQARATWTRGGAVLDVSDGVFAIR